MIIFKKPTCICNKAYEHLDCRGWTLFSTPSGSSSSLRESHLGISWCLSRLCDSSRSQCVSFTKHAPGERALSTEPLVLYVAMQDVLRPLQQHRERHPWDVAFLGCRDFVTEGELQQRLKTHFRKLFSQANVNLRFCKIYNIWLLVKC